MTLQAMTPFGISEAQLKALQDTLAQVPQLEQAIIYGSRAMGTHKTFSDIDIALKGEKLQDEHLSQLNEAIDQLLLPTKLTLPPSLASPTRHFSTTFNAGAKSFIQARPH